MKKTSIHADIEAISQETQISAPNLGSDNTEAAIKLAAFCNSCGISELGTLILLMKFSVERGCLDDGKDRWPVESLSVAMHGAYGIDWNRERLWLTLLEIAGMRLHVMAFDSPEIAFFENQQRNDQAMQSGLSADDRARYEELKAQWRRHHGELDQLLLHRENTLLQREVVRQTFMRKFPHYLQEREQQLRLAIVEFKLDALKRDPALSREELNRQAEKKLNQATASLLDDQRTSEYAQTAEESTLSGFSSQREVAEFRKRLKVLFMLLHPDRLLHVPLTEAQRGELRRLWDDCQGVNVKNATEHELARCSELVEYSIEKARAILAQAGIDIDPGLIIQGGTIEERTLWLERAILRIRRDLEILRDELKDWRHDREIAAMSALLCQSDEQKYAQHEEMRDRADDCAARADSSEAELDRLLSTRHSS